MRAKALNLSSPELYIKRDLAWLSFNERVLREAESPHVPLLERLKFCSIFSSNLDEFFMVRLSSLLRLMEQHDTLSEVSLRVQTLVQRLAKCLHEDILPELEKNHLCIVPLKKATKTEREVLHRYFEEQIFPVLTPLAIDPAHPFPFLANLSMYLLVTFKELPENREDHLAFVEVPHKIPRFIPLNERNGRFRFVFIEDLIRENLGKLFPWAQIKESHIFRVTRNYDYQLLEGEVKNLLESIELELKDRAQKPAVRLEFAKGLPENLQNKLIQELAIDRSEAYEIEGMLNMRDVSELLKVPCPENLRDAPFNPRIHPRLVDESHNIFEIIKEKDVLLHHPYDSFASVLSFLHQAAIDPNVLAIKQTLYRTGGDSPIIEALVEAAEKGKQVTAVVELKARFDEANNIEWAKRLERAGAHVVYGFVGLKTHAKCTLVVRKEGEKLQRYAHLSTGNYNSTTAKMYTDLGYLTTDPVLGEDIAKLFNLLTGFNFIVENHNIKHNPGFKKIKVAPFNLREHITALIQNEIKLHTNENPGHIILKINSLVDTDICASLYKASMAGVRVDLIVRGVCVLRPGILGLSHNIRVISIIDRFLEHSRIYWFKNSGNAKVFCGSADIMPRNLNWRIEVCWPIENAEIKRQIEEILSIYLADNSKSSVMHSDGTYSTLKGNKEDVLIRCQEKFIDMVRNRMALPVNYDQEKDATPVKKAQRKAVIRKPLAIKAAS